MVKYKKELDYIMKHYMNEEKKRNFLKQKAVNTLSRNTNLIKKIQEVIIGYKFRLRLKIWRMK